MSKRASYKAGVQWIADNDDVGANDALDLEVVAAYISTSLLADLFGKDPKDVASDVIKQRHKQWWRHKGA